MMDWSEFSPGSTALGHETAEHFSRRIKEKHGLAEFRVYESAHGGLKLDMLAVPRGERGLGRGSAAMQDLVDYADRRGLTVRLTPALKDPRWGTTSRKRLVRFYKRFGFVENKGRYKDFTIGASEMYRLPKQRPSRA